MVRQGETGPCGHDDRVGQRQRSRNVEDMKNVENMNYMVDTVDTENTEDIEDMKDTEDMEVTEDEKKVTLMIFQYCVILQCSVLWWRRWSVQATRRTWRETRSTQHMSRT